MQQLPAGSDPCSGPCCACGRGEQALVQSHPHLFHLSVHSLTAQLPSWAAADALPCVQDPDGWCDLTQFDLPEEPSAGSSSSGNTSPAGAAPSQAALALPSVTEYRLDGHTISDLSRSSKGELIPISPHAEGSFGTPPSVLKRQKKRKSSLSPVTETVTSTSMSFLDSCNSMTPKGTPVKTLPFSPSQVSSCPNARYSLQLCQLCAPPALNEAMSVCRECSCAKRRLRAGFWPCFSSVLPFLWEQKPVSLSGSDHSFKIAQLSCLRGRASAQHEEGTLSACQGVMESTLLLSPGHCCPSCGQQSGTSENLLSLSIAVQSGWTENTLCRSVLLWL